MNNLKRMVAAVTSTALIGIAIAQEAAKEQPPAGDVPRGGNTAARHPARVPHNSARRERRA